MLQKEKCLQPRQVISLSLSCHVRALLEKDELSTIDVEVIIHTNLSVRPNTHKMFPLITDERFYSLSVSLVSKQTYTNKYKTSINIIRRIPRFLTKKCLRINLL